MSGGGGTGVVIKTEPLESDGAVPAVPVVVAPDRVNNNRGGASAKTKDGKNDHTPSCFLHIVKEEPPEEPAAASSAGSNPAVQTASTPPSSAAATVPGPGPPTLVVSADGGIVIKTEVLEEKDDDEDEDVFIGVDDDDKHIEEEEEDDLEDSELDFEDDDDEDFEIDSSEAADTPDSSGGSSGGVKRGRGGRQRSDKKEDDGAEKEDSSPVEKGSFDFNGMTIETEGNYSKCPKCLKNIKSTFIIRHIKLHDAPSEKYNCPEKGCTLQVRTYYSHHFLSQFSFPNFLAQIWSMMQVLETLSSSRRFFCF